MPDADLKLLTDAARAAGQIALSYVDASPEIWEKSGGQGPVTEADLHVNRQLLADLRSARPDYGWLSEESEDDDARLRTDRQFIVDPIDGTRAFIEGTKDWAHSIAIAQAGRIIAGVVYLPRRDALYAAVLGGGATLNDTPLTVSTQTDMQAATLLSARPNYDPKHWKAAPPAAKRAFRSSLAYRLALVAEGRFDGMLALRKTWEWDVAAGSLIVEEAGGHASDRSGQPARFNNAHPQINGMVAAGALHGPLVAGLR